MSARRVLALLFVAVLCAAAWALRTFGEIVSGYAAKTECSCLFVADRERASCLDGELASYTRFFHDRIDGDARSVETTAFWLVQARADYAEGRGCTLR